jgi:cardiolipin synthase
MLDNNSFLGRHLAAMQAISKTPLIAGNRVQLLVDGPRAYQAMFAAIAAAQNHVNIEMFIFDEARQGGKQLSDLLVERAHAGIVVNVLYDSVGSRHTSAQLLEKLRNAGVSLCEFNPLNPTRSRTATFTQRDHRKVVVVDGRTAFAGGINFSGVYSSGSNSVQMGSDDPKETGWRDTQVQVDGPASLEIQQSFLDGWSKQRCPQLRDATYLPAAQSAGDTLLRIDVSSQDAKESETYVAAMSVVTLANQNIDLTMAYFSPDSALEAALRAAAKRGVRVRLLLSGLSDFSGVVQAGRSHYTRLLKAGVLIYEERGALLHAKTLQVDGVWSTVGSANWDWLSFANNDELNVVVIDQQFAEQMTSLYETDLANATAITRESWRARSLAQRARELFWAAWQRFL